MNPLSFPYYVVKNTFLGCVVLFMPEANITDFMNFVVRHIQYRALLN